jgi:hypothetical protein
MRKTRIALALLLAGCGGGAGASAVRESTIPAGLGRYRTAFVEVTSDDPEQQEGVRSLKFALLSRLSALRCFDSFVTGVEPRGADLHLSVVLLDASGAGEAERILLGGLAEKPRVVVEVRLVDLRTRALVGKFRVEGASSGGSATARALPEAFEKAGVEIAEYLHLHE